MSRPIYQIAEEIKKDGHKVKYATVPYLEAMYSLDKIADDYCGESGRNIVIYFLNNARGWRGPITRRIKKELKDILNGQEKLDL